MREISTHIDIEASASLVWDILTDFATYRRWNPTVSSIRGNARRGDTLFITQRRAVSSPRSNGAPSVRRMVKHVREPRELYWLGTWGSASLFASERRFRIESLADGHVRFHQSERFGGIVVPFVWAGLRRRLIADFGAMNGALKERAERAESEFEARRTRPGRGD